jgi:hypothetical protein
VIADIDVALDDRSFCTCAAMVPVRVARGANSMICAVTTSTRGRGACTCDVSLLQPANSASKSAAAPAATSPERSIPRD